MNVIEQIGEAFGLPAWLAGTPTGKKLLAEREESEKEAARAAFAERKELAESYSAALHADETDEELALLARRKEDLRAKVDGAEKLIADLKRELVDVDTETVWRRKALKAETAALRNLLIASEPPEIQSFLDKLRALDEETARANTQAFDITEGVTPGPHFYVSFSTIRPSQIVRREAIGRAVAAVKKMRFQSLTSAELSAKFAALVKELPSLTPTKYSRNRNNELVAAAA